jgi:D-glycero-D-manno-heptose 1,7-bisphosphate phosphatase
MRTAVFIERDGILNLPKVEGQYQIAPRTVNELVLNRDAVKPLETLKAAGFSLIATSNQPGISRGYMSRCELDLMHAIILKAFPLDDILMCTHDEWDRCPCRKPKPGLFREASFKWQIDLDHSFVLSDKWQDAKAAQNSGCTSILVKSPWNGTGHHDFIVPNLEVAVEKIAEVVNYFSMLGSRHSAAA